MRTTSRLIQNNYLAGGEFIWTVVVENAVDPNDTIFGTQSLGNWTTRPNTTGYYTNRLLPGGIADMGFSVSENEGGGLADTASATIAIDTTDSFMDALDGYGVILEGKEIRVWINLPDDDGYTDAICVWGGVIVDVEDGADSIVLHCDGNDTVYHREIPVNVYEEFGDFPWEEFIINENMEGKALPYVFGDHPYAEGHTLSESWDDGSSDRGHVVQFCDPDLASGFLIKEFVSVRWGDSGLQVATGGYADILEGGTGGFPYSPFTWSGTNGWISFDTHDVGHLYLTLMCRLKSWLGHTPTTTGSGVLNHINAVNGDWTDLALIPAAVTTESTIREIMFKFPQIGISGDVLGGHVDAMDIYAVLHADPSATGWSAGNRYWGIYLCRAMAQGFEGATCLQHCWGDAAGTGADDPTITRNNWGTDPLTEPPDAAGARDFRMKSDGLASGPYTSFNELSELSQCFCGLGVKRDTSDSGFAFLYNLGFLVDCRIDFPADGFYANLKGYSDNSAGTITGTGNSLLCNPAHLLSFIWGYCTNAGNARVDTLGFRDLAAARGYVSSSVPGWLFAHQIVDRENTADTLAAIGKQSLIWTWVDCTGTAKGFSMTAPAGQDEPTTSMLPGMVDKFDRVRRLDTAEVASRFLLKYGANPVAGDYDGALTCSQTTSTPILYYSRLLCSNANEYFLDGRERDAEDFELDWIYDEDTAIAVAELHIKRKTSRPWSIEWTSDIGLFWLELGDPVEFPEDQWRGVIHTAALDKTYRITSVVYSPGEASVRYRATEVYE